MKTSRRFLSVFLVSSLLLVATPACGGASAPAPAATKAPDKTVASATTAPQPAAAATAAPQTAVTSQPTVASKPASQPASSSVPKGSAPDPLIGSEILIGDNTPVTGASASEGSFHIKAMNLAQKQINASGGVNGKKIKIVMQDNQSTNPGALAAFNKNVEQDKVLAILGPIKSTQILAMNDAIKQAGVPTVIGGTNVTLTSQGNPWIFRTRPDDGIGALAMVKYIAEDLKLTKVGILHDTDAFGTGGADQVEKYVKEKGLTLVKREKYTTKDKDFTAQLLALKGAGAEVMAVYATNPEDTAVIARQYRQLGSPYKWVGSVSTGTQTNINLAKEAAEGLIGVADYVPGESEESKKYIEDYKKEYNEDMEPSAAYKYDSLLIFANVIKQVGEDRSKIRDAMLGIKGYKGVLGTYNFSANGDGLHELSMIKIEKGKQVLVKIVKVD